MRVDEHASQAIHLWLVMMKASRTMVRHAERSIEATDLCLSDFGVLELLLHKGPQRLTDIGARIELTSGAVTIAVDRLEGRGLVARGFGEGDRRVRIVSLTPAGSGLIRRAFAHHAKAMARAANGLTAAEVATLTRLLKKLGTTAEQHLENHP
jgi:MarR family 2-MHQ and catechol resistance regulon transcriptional repressor